MEFLKSIGLLFTGVLKKWYLLLVAIVSDPADLLEGLFGMDLMIPLNIRLAVFWIALVLAVILTYHDLRKKNILLEQAPKTATQLSPRKQNDLVIQSLSSQMIIQHKLTFTVFTVISLYIFACAKLHYLWRTTIFTLY